MNIHGADTDDQKDNSHSIFRRADSNSSVDSFGNPRTRKMREKLMSKVFKQNFQYLAENDFFS